MKTQTSATALLVSGMVAAGGVAASAAPDILSDPVASEIPATLFAEEEADLLILAPDPEQEIVGAGDDAFAPVLAQTIYGGDPDDTLRRGRTPLYGGGATREQRPRVTGPGGQLYGGPAMPAPGGDLRQPREGLIDGTRMCCTIEAN